MIPAFCFETTSFMGRLVGQKDWFHLVYPAVVLPPYFDGLI
jgi:hypothetical protein